MVCPDTPDLTAINASENQHGFTEPDSVNEGVREFNYRPCGRHRAAIGCEHRRFYLAISHGIVSNQRIRSRLHADSAQKEIAEEDPADVQEAERAQDSPGNPGYRFQAAHRQAD